MIEVSHLVKEFSNDGKVFRAVDDVSFQVKKGEIYGIIGLSGAGKSTLVRCLNRLEEPTSGKIVIDGVDMVALSKKELLNQRKDIGMIFQHFNLFLQKTVYDNIAYPLEIQKWPKEKIQARVEELLDFIDLKDKRGVYPSSLSGGQKQRVAIARALATSPKILLSDEGTSALDPINTRMVVETLKKTVKDLNTTIIMITHQMEVAKDICDRIAVMENGKIIEENTVEELFRAPKTKQTQKFISSLRESDNPDQNIDLTKYKGRVLRLSYDDQTVDQPILSRCIKDYQVDVNLLSGNMNRLDVKDFGYMIVEVLGSDQQVDQALAFMKEKGVYVEVLK
ncbi:Methionine import ATP-binding protein MetN [Urinicoccus massiliensis]|uniref:Methionine import ATP-binding protein MetN n=1 Tax=Urinicoccus massiliensis TaxID=1723382 RepID=A0A8H2M2U3_9FIRM|nr:ATP-binding cassette domain-containing protein [Urinicoccus massiliensis]VFB15579.1 Methionine import ATP-binding protein MetN [Urinicoccus massiliensis]